VFGSYGIAVFGGKLAVGGGLYAPFQGLYPPSGTNSQGPLILSGFYGRSKL